MSGRANRVKLQIYQHQSEEIVIDEHEATDWGDFVIVHLKAPTEWWTTHNSDPIMSMFSEWATKTGKEVLLLPADWDIDFYGIEVEGEEEARPAELLGKETSGDG